MPTNPPAIPLPYILIIMLGGTACAPAPSLLYYPFLSQLPITTMTYKSIKAKPALLYYIRLTFPDSLVLYKIGYTTMRLSARIYGIYARSGVHMYGMGLPTGTDVVVIKTWRYRCKATCYSREQILHAQYSMYRYRGTPRIASGYTELYVRDVLGLDDTASAVV